MDTLISIEQYNINKQFIYHGKANSSVNKANIQQTHVSGRLRYYSPLQKLKGTKPSRLKSMYMHGVSIFKIEGLQVIS